MIKLKKDVWVIKNIDEVCESIFAGGDVPKNSFSKTKTDKLTVPIFSNGEKDKGLFGYTDIEIVIKPSLTISARGTIGYSEIREGRYYPAVRLIVLIPNIRIIDLFFLKIAISNIDFASSGTSIPQLTVPMVKKYAIPLPPLDEQQRIVELFQSIEQSIVQTEAQEKNLRRLCKSLIDGLISDEPSFGNLPKGKKLKQVYYRDVAQKLTRKIDPVSYGIERIVAGENMESEDFKIRTWGTVGKDFLGPAFHVLFQAGDILYGSRRTYLKKVALADFEGVCANTTYVIRANEEVLLQDLLKHIMLSERFTQYSIGVSKGSTNPYINWKDLDNFVFEIPDLETQRVITDLLDEILANAEKVREQKETLKKLKQKLLNEILG